MEYLFYWSSKEYNISFPFFPNESEKFIFTILRVFDSYIKEKSSQAALGLDFFVNLIVALYSIIWYYIDISYIEVVL